MTIPNSILDLSVTTPDRLMSEAHTKRFKRQMDIRYEQLFADAPVDVLVLGPNLNKKDHDDAAKLRNEILERCRDYGASVMGEHKELIRQAKERFLAGHNLCSYEVILAEEVDLIVLVPASPGSFAELGLLAVHATAGPKTVILFSREFSRNRSSYIKQGPKKAFENRNAKIKYVDYSDVDFSWRIVKRAIERVKATKVDKELFGQ